MKFSDEPSTSYAGGDDMDDEIARLEKELMDGMNDSDDSGSSSEDDEDEVSNSNSNPAILSLSSFADDRVKSLPTTCLPVPGKYSLTKKRKGKKTNQPPQVKSGLQKAVEEVLGGYTARSSEKKSVLLSILLQTIRKRNSLLRAQRFRISQNCCSIGEKGYILQALSQTIY